MIEHTVTIRLVHRACSPEEKGFFEGARKPAAIPGVRDYTIERQTSPNLPHTFGIAMHLASS